MTQLKSWLTIQVIESAVRNFIEAWNCHRIIPNVLAARAPQTTALPSTAVPMVSEMVALYCQGGRRLTPEHSFGTDPRSELQHLRIRYFFIVTLTYKQSTLFKEALLYFISLTNSFSMLV